VIRKVVIGLVLSQLHLQLNPSRLYVPQQDKHAVATDLTVPAFI